MKKLLTTVASVAMPLLALAIGWPENYTGVMLQGFYWDSYSDTKWKKLEAQADEFEGYFDLVWIPQSAYCGGTSMGYDDLYWFTNYNSSFGTEAQLRSMISTFKSKGIGTIADVVINHRKNVSTWVDFPAEEYNGVTYQLQSTDICKDDDGGETAKHTNGLSLSENNDTGEDWSGMRDLDHKSENVQTNVKAYLKMLLDDLGYVGFRYDMVKGYSGMYTKIYNTYAEPEFSVGEHWTNSSSISSWVNLTGKTSAGFDFDFRYSTRDAFNQGNMTYLNKRASGQYAMNSQFFVNGQYRRWAVTFLENHDTEYRSSTSQQDPLKKDTIAANAFMLAMPGTPCVFYKHWQAYPEEIKAMIDVRKAVGIHNMSETEQKLNTKECYAIEIMGDGDKSLTAVIGTTDNYVPDPADGILVLKGYHFCYYMSPENATAWVDKASCTFSEPFDATMTAVTNASGVKLVYTTDGSEPTASSTQVESGYVLNVSESMVLKVGLLIDGAVSGVVTRVYNYEETEPFTPHTATVYVKDPTVSPWNWTPLYYWAWDSKQSLNTNKSWPGDPMEQTTTIKGDLFYYQTFNIDEEGYTFNFIFSKKGSPQTVDITGIDQDIYLELEQEPGVDGKYDVIDITDQYTNSIDETLAEGTEVNGPTNVYTIDGRLVRAAVEDASTATQGLAPGLYIVNHKKVVVR